MEKAKSSIAALYTDDHPLSVKFNQNLIEAYNLRPESKERTQLVNEICARNVEISEAFFGKQSLYLVRPLYTLYTARLHEETDDGSSAALSRMADLIYNGEPVRTN